MIKHITFWIVLLFPLVLIAQKKLDAVLAQYNDEGVPYISTEALHKQLDAVVLLDAREQKEYKVSHIANAIPVGYTHFTMTTIEEQKLAKDTPIVVYCSLGVRSEAIGEQLKAAGYTNVSNLYGGIFEWKNKNHTVVDTIGNPTERVHAFDKQWGKWLKKGKKVY